MKSMILTLILAFLSVMAFGQEMTSVSYKSYALGFDKSDALSEQVDAAALKEGEFCFVVKSKEGRTFSIGYYDHQGNLQSYLLDRYFNLYFSYITFKYENEFITEKHFKNPADFTLAKIQYEYNEGKKISKTVLSIYSLMRRELVKLEETRYTYSGENYETVERYNRRDQTFERMVYKGGKQMQEYHRYDLDGKTLQYLVKFFYDGEKVSKKEIYSKTGVLLKTLPGDAVASK